MVKPRQLRNLIFGLSLGAATAVLAIAFMLVVVAPQPAQAQTFNVIHTFTGGQDGANPTSGGKLLDSRLATSSSLRRPETRCSLESKGVHHAQ